MAKTYSIVALDDLSTLAGLLIKFGGEFPLLAERRRVWLSPKVHNPAALLTLPASELFEPTEDYYLDMATLAGKLHKQLVEIAENHGAPPAVRA